MGGRYSFGVHFRGCLNCVLKRMLERVSSESGEREYGAGSDIGEEIFLRGRLMFSMSY